MATAIIGAKIDYCNSLLYGTMERNLNRLQKVQNATARIVHQASFQTTATALCQQLHWLPIRKRQAGDPYFQGEVLSDPSVSSRTALRPSGG